MTPISPDQLPEFAVGHDVLAVPATRDIVELAHSRYADAEWRITPDQAAESVRSVRYGGARFRGMAPAAAQVQAQLALTESLVLVGPSVITGRDAQRLGLAATDHALFALPEEGGVAEATDMRAWALAVARHSGGAIIQSSGTVLRPDPASAVDLQLFSPDPQPMERVLSLLRPVLPRAATFTGEDGSTGIFVELEYDGTIVVALTRATRDVPLTLKSVDWREYGPHIYTASWLPPDSAELEAAEPSQLHLIARRRAAPLLARAVQHMQRELSGTVLDADGFLVSATVLKDRAMGRHTVG